MERPGTVYQMMRYRCCGVVWVWWRKADGVFLEPVFPMDSSLCGCGRAAVAGVVSKVTWCEEGCMMFFEEVL